MKEETTGSPFKQVKDNRAIRVQNNNTYVPEHETENHLNQGPGNHRKIHKTFYMRKGQWTSKANLLQTEIITMHYLKGALPCNL